MEAKELIERLENDDFKNITNGDIIKIFFNNRLIDNRSEWQALKVIIGEEWWNKKFTRGDVYES